MFISHKQNDRHTPPAALLHEEGGEFMDPGKNSFESFSENI